MLKTMNNRSEMPKRGTKESSETNKEVMDVNERETPSKAPSSKAVKCKWENTRLCKLRDNCSEFHPKKTCPAHSKLGQCPAPSSCPHRHPNVTCREWTSNRACSRNDDDCRFNHPLSYFLGVTNSPKVTTTTTPKPMGMPLRPTMTVTRPTMTSNSHTPKVTSPWSAALETRAMQVHPPPQHQRDQGQLSLLHQQQQLQLQIDQQWKAQQQVQQQQQQQMWWSKEFPRLPEIQQNRYPFPAVRQRNGTFQ